MLDYNGLVPAAKKATRGEEVESRYVSEFHDYREQLTQEEEDDGEESGRGRPEGPTT